MSRVERLRPGDAVNDIVKGNNQVLEEIRKSTLNYAQNKTLLLLKTEKALT